MVYRRILFQVIACAVFFADGFAQRYNFQHYDIDDGLAQSQVTSVTQDNKRRIWVTTLAGINCFNGKQFSSYSKINGLNSNFTIAIAADQQNNLYIGSAMGLSRYNGSSFYNYTSDQNWVGKLVSDKKGTVYGIRGKRLFKILGKDLQLLNVTGEKLEFVSTIETDPSGKLWAAVYQKGLYYFDHGKWTFFTGDQVTGKLLISDLIIDHTDPYKIWLLASDGLYLHQNGTTRRIHPEIPFKMNALVQDASGGIWIGTNSGAFYSTPTQFIHFNSKNGFTDNVVNDLFADAEHNIWLATDGAGLFKFSNNSYVTFDETQGIDNRIVMAITKAPKKNTLMFGSYGGLYEYTENQKIRNIKIPSSNKDAYRINFLHTDRKNRVWIGTPGGGLWCYDDNKIKRIPINDEHVGYNGITEDAQGLIWLSTNYGVLTYDPSSSQVSQLTRQFGGSLLELGKDSIISGTQNGAWLIVNKGKAAPMNIVALKGSSILCMVRDQDHVLFGTSDYGLVIWNRKTGKTRSLNSKSGLGADHIYSILKDSQGTIWLGTGKGIDRLRSSDYSVIKTSSRNAPLVECNQNAILEHDNKIWIGTTKGVMVFGLDPPKEKKVSPYVFINSVSVYASQQQSGESDTSGLQYKERELEKAHIFPYRQNRITISYTGIHLTNPGDVFYRYRLLGLDNKYSQPINSSTMTFTAIPAGKYTFQVKALTKDGMLSLNTASFSFEIRPPYYQTNLFRALMVLLIVLVIVLAVYVILTLNERKRKLRLKIKLEEQFNIRKQTAEDFHDDLGNKLTRITVLSEVLSSMIDQNDTEKRNILNKIRKNVDELYNGTKDILWSLNPENDTLTQLLDHIKEFGMDMFNDTSILFKSEIDHGKDTRLSLDMSRNILMIFKEAIHNALKHSKARQVNYQARLNNDMLLITLQDDGLGFDTAYGKNGHGINNMYVRAARINADLNIIADQNGTTICLLVNFSTLAHFKNV